MIAVELADLDEHGLHPSAGRPEYPRPAGPRIEDRGKRHHHVGRAAQLEDEFSGQTRSQVARIFEVYFDGKQSAGLAAGVTDVDDFTRNGTLIEKRLMTG